MEHSAEIVAIVVANLLTVIVYVVTTRERVNAISKRVDLHDENHKDHYSHAGNRAIHQESMDAKLLQSEFHAMKTQLNLHAADDRRVFDEIKSDLKDIRAAVQDVREHMRPQL